MRDHCRKEKVDDQVNVEDNEAVVKMIIEWQRKIDDLNNVDFIYSNVNSSRKEALLYVFEDNEAVIKMIFKGRSPTTRHVSRTHRVA